MADVRCECGHVMGEACAWEGPIEETVRVEHMPQYQRGNHVKAGGHGRYPANGAIRLRVHRECAARLIEGDGEWTREVGP